jgi:WD40 repeat protein
VTSADWPVPLEVQKLVGHTNEIVQAAFSPGGAMLATASLDGSVRVS